MYLFFQISGHSPSPSLHIIGYAIQVHSGYSVHLVVVSGYRPGTAQLARPIPPRGVWAPNGWHHESWIHLWRSVSCPVLFPTPRSDELHIRLYNFRNNSPESQYPERMCPQFADWEKQKQNSSWMEGRRHFRRHVVRVYNLLVAVFWSAKVWYLWYSPPPCLYHCLVKICDITNKSLYVYYWETGLS